MSREVQPVSARDREIERLRRARPQSRFARCSVLAFVGLVTASWILGGFGPGDMLSARRLHNLDRFLGEVVPRTEASSVAWYAELFADRGLDALVTTLAISVAAIVLAAAAASVLSLLAARNPANPEPFLPAARPPSAARRWAWRAVAELTRLCLVFLRSIPEYVWAFVFLTMLGPIAWPAVLALWIHNAGILGRLGGEVIENVDVEAPRAARGLGAGRAQIAAAVLFPLSLNRFLLYFFYRWETCVRESTILGMLGIVSLGFWIQQARAANRYDEMVFFVALGAALIVAGDAASALARSIIRRAS